MSEDNKQNERIVRLETESENINKLLGKIDDNMVTKSEFKQIIESFNNYKNTTKQYFDFKLDEHKCHLNDLCKRTRSLEKIVNGDNIKDILTLYDKAKRIGLYVIVVLGFAVIAIIGKDKI